MRIIGLTGGIACGKSTVSLTLRRLGARIIDGDILSRELTTADGIALPEIRRHFGDAVFDPDGTLNRRALASIIFNDPEARAQLDAIMQPLLLIKIKEQILRTRECGIPICVLDMPLLYEAGLETLCDSVWCVWIPADEQMRRLQERDGLTEEEARSRIASQMSTDEKAARSRVVIDTSGSIEETASKIPELFEAELKEV